MDVLSGFTGWVLICVLWRNVRWCLCLVFYYVLWLRVRKERDAVEKERDFWKAMGRK